ncbi:MAG: hypothetical protein JXB29_12800 [Sedimentisphaerales bacterium]|nr:hypothetical protein [Sedimentisphaerales bacterium]
MRKFAIVLLLIAAVCPAGCGVVSLLGNPTSFEKKVAAEFNLISRKKQKLLVLVDQQLWTSTQVDMRYDLTEALDEILASKVKFPAERLVSYSELTKMRSEKRDFSQLLPVEQAKALSVDLILLVDVEQCYISCIAETGCCGGYLFARAALYDTAWDDRLWPETAEYRDVTIGFDIEPDGPDAAVKRLAKGAAHCISRYFYDCPKAGFKISDDKSGEGWQNWNNEKGFGD